MRRRCTQSKHKARLRLPVPAAVATQNAPHGLCGFLEKDGRSGSEKWDKSARRIRKDYDRPKPALLLESMNSELLELQAKQQSKEILRGTLPTPTTEPGSLALLQ